MLTQVVDGAARLEEGTAGPVVVAGRTRLVEAYVEIARLADTAEALEAVPLWDERLATVGRTQLVWGRAEHRPPAAAHH